MLGYEFVTLTDEQKAARRHLLDLYGNIGQWSILVVLILLQLAFFIRWAIFRTVRAERPRSPHPNKVMDFGTRAWYWRLEDQITRFRWWANQSLREGWFTKGECVLGLVWTLWLLFLSVHRTGNGTSPVSASSAMSLISTSRLFAPDKALWHGCSIPTPSPVHPRHEISILANPSVNSTVLRASHRNP